MAKKAVKNHAKKNSKLLALKNSLKKRNNSKDVVEEDHEEIETKVTHLFNNGKKNKETKKNRKRRSSTSSSSSSAAATSDVETEKDTDEDANVQQQRIPKGGKQEGDLQSGSSSSSSINSFSSGAKFMLGSKKSKAAAAAVDNKTESVEYPNHVVEIQHVRGLINLGNTCFFNSVLQCLSHTVILRRILLNEEDIATDSTLFNSLIQLIPQTSFFEYPTIGSLTSSIRKLLTHMQVPGNVIRPTSVFEQVCQKAPRFRGFRQQDSQELLRYLLDGMIDEENQRWKDFAGKYITGNEEIAEKAAILKKDPVTFVHRIFGGLLQSRIVCHECGNVSSVLENTLDISLSIPSSRDIVDTMNELHVSNRKKSNKKEKKQLAKEKKGKKKEEEEVSDADEEEESASDKVKALSSHSLATLEMNTNERSLRNALYQFCKPELLSGENKYQCEACGKRMTKEQEEKGKEKENDDSTTNNAEKEEEGEQESTSKEEETSEDWEEVDKEDGEVDKKEMSETDPTSNKAKDSKIEVSNSTESGDFVLVTKVEIEAIVHEEITSATTVTSDNNDTTIGENQANTPTIEAEKKDESSDKERSEEGEVKAEQTEKREGGEVAEKEGKIEETEKEKEEVEEEEDEDEEEEEVSEEEQEESKGEKKKPLVKYTNATKQLLLYELPPVLTIHIKRFQQVGRRFEKSQDFVKFDVDLDLSPFVSKDALLKNGNEEQKRTEDGDEYRYSLYGVVEHSGGLNGGHYIAYVRPSRQSDTWYYISDSSTRQVKLSEVLRAQAYLLFYERV